jgi:DNA end-binding protein Ku
VTITKRNLKASKPKANKSIDLKEFIPLASVDPVCLENTPFLGADQGGEKTYRLLCRCHSESGRVAIAELVSRGKEQLVLIRPYCKGLVRHTI